MSETAPTWRPATGGCGAPNIDEARDTLDFPLGAIITIQKSDGTMAEAIYLQADTGYAADASVSYNPSTLATGSGSGSASAIPAITANQYGWFRIDRAGA